MRLGRRLITGVAEHPPAREPEPRQPATGDAAVEAGHAAEPERVELAAER